MKKAGPEGPASRQGGFAFNKTYGPKTLFRMLRPELCVPLLRGDRGVVLLRPEMASQAKPYMSA